MGLGLLFCSLWKDGRCLNGDSFLFPLREPNAGRRSEAALSGGGTCENLGILIRHPFKVASDHVTLLLKTPQGLPCHSEQNPKSSDHLPFCCRKADPFQGLKLGSCLTLGNELSEETRVLTKQKTLLEKGTWVESSRVREPRRTALPHGSQSRVLW